jgi:peptidoglycan L-alanyl-D-glutamate endopeptidase CwlK
MSSRRIEDLCGELQVLYFKWADEMEAAGIDFLITCTSRTQAEQDRLYAQGRTLPGKIVTWTKNSRHVAGEAFDFVIMENGKPDWRISNPSWTLAGNLVEKVGLEWGGRWRSPDFPHAQIEVA